MSKKRYALYPYPEYTKISNAGKTHSKDPFRNQSTERECRFPGRRSSDLKEGHFVTPLYHRRRAPEPFEDKPKLKDPIDNEKCLSWCWLYHLIRTRIPGEARPEGTLPEAWKAYNDAAQQNFMAPGPSQLVDPTIDHSSRSRIQIDVGRSKHSDSTQRKKIESDISDVTAARG